MADNQVPIQDNTVKTEIKEKPTVEIASEVVSEVIASPSVKEERMEIVKAAMLPRYQLQARLEPYGEKTQVKKTANNILKNLFGF